MSHFISLREAKELIGRYKVEKDQVLKREYENVLSFSESFNRDAFDTLLKKPGCEGLRFYFGMFEDRKVTLVAVAVDANGNDILDARNNNENEVLDDIVEKGTHCPPNCPSFSVF